MRDSLLAAARGAAARYGADGVAALLERPVFIVAAPRSGSNLLFEQLSRCAGFWTIGGESHAVYGAFPHLRAENAAPDSGRLTARHADPATREGLRTCFAFLARDHAGETLADAAPERLRRRLRLLEKTPRNALNIPFLLAVFPDARFIYLHRDPFENTASLAEAWEVGLRTGRFVTFRGLPGWDRPVWCFLLPPGWRDLRGRSLVEIAAFQWSAANDCIVDDLAALPRERWRPVTYRALVDRPAGTVAELARFAGVSDAAAAGLRAGHLAVSRTATSPPDPDKWRRYERELAALEPMLQATARRIRAFCEPPRPQT